MTVHGLPTKERFWRKVRIGGDGECWLWLGARMKYGYGSFFYEGKTILAHRLAFALANNLDIKQVGQLNHTCNGGYLCVNPRHLYTGTKLQNIHDAINSGRYKKLSSQEVNQLREACSTGNYTLAQLASWFKIKSVGYVSLLVNNKRRPKDAS